VEYAKEGTEDMLIRITAHNRGPETARLRLLPTLWFRNTWSWGEEGGKPSLREVAPGIIQASHPELGDYWLHCEGDAELLFTENESNAGRLWGQRTRRRMSRMLSTRTSSEARPQPSTARRRGRRPPPLRARRAGGESRTVGCVWQPPGTKDPFGDFEKIFKSRIADADEFYDRITPKSLTEISAASPAGAGRHAVGQAVLLLRSRALAARAQEPSAARVGAP
jgi:hypothetical protein